MPRFTLRINGRTHQVEAEAHDRLLSVLRYDLGLTGSKYGCGEAQCGACTVHVDGQAARSCTMRVGDAAGKMITTIEGLANGERLHPVQEAFIEAEAYQCGYCTPGMVMGAASLLKTTPNPSDHDIARLMQGHVCRCGTYARIVRAVRLAASRTKSSAKPATESGSRP
jgi:aerobic-type carbon monoxide dehydrogenase small subunit (CoxS/CutS family)